MSKLILDPALRAELSQAPGEVELCDEAGEAVGYFVPPGLFRELLTAWVHAEFAEEGDRAAALEEFRRDGGVSTAEVLAHLERLDRSNGTTAS